MSERADADSASVDHANVDHTNVDNANVDNANVDNANVDSANANSVDAYNSGADNGHTDGAAVDTHNTEQLSGNGITDSRPEYVDFSVEDFPGGLRACLEAILMVADQPQQTVDIARVLAVSESAAQNALVSLQHDYDEQQRGFELRCTARGWQFASRATFEPVVSALMTDGQTARLSQAALEALAIIAYKQPVTRAQIAAIRGVNSDGVIRSLMVRGLVRESGMDEDSRAALLVTSDLFLEKMGLDSLDRLPSLAPFLPSSAGEVTDEVQDLQGER